MAVLVNNGKLFVNKHGRHGMSQARQRKQESERARQREREHSHERQREQINRSLRLACVGELRNARAFCCCLPEKEAEAEAKAARQTGSFCHNCTTRAERNYCATGNRRGNTDNKQHKAPSCKNKNRRQTTIIKQITVKLNNSVCVCVCVKGREEPRCRRQG